MKKVEWIVGSEIIDCEEIINRESFLILFCDFSKFVTVSNSKYNQVCNVIPNRGRERHVLLRNNDDGDI